MVRRADGNSAERKYFEWLVDVSGLDWRHWSRLLKVLFESDFDSNVLDDNRAVDGRDLLISCARELRDRSLRSYDFGENCSILELFVSLADKMAYEAEGLVVGMQTLSDWFTEILNNLGLLVYHNANWRKKSVQDIVYRFNSRRYDSDGFGGAFPLRAPQQDQREVELWYQMNAYLLERTKME